MGRRSLVAVTTLALAALVGGCSDDDVPGPPVVTARPSDQEPAPSTTTPRPRRRPARTSRAAPGRRHRGPQPFGALGHRLPARRHRDRHRARHPSGAHDRRARQGRPRSVRCRRPRPRARPACSGSPSPPTSVTTGLMFLYVTTPEDNRIMRGQLRGGRLGPLEVVLAGIPNGFIHDGGRLQFGPDGYLYASTGETGASELAQDRDSLGGKILRITPDGDPAPGNPDPSSPIWTLGHRNVQGLAFDDQDNLWASEFGDSTFDELNLIRKGGNYGWPLFEGRGRRPGLHQPAGRVGHLRGFALRPRLPRRPALARRAERRAALADRRRRRSRHQADRLLRREVRPAAHRGRGARRQPLGVHVQPGRPGHAGPRRRPDPGDRA